MSYMLNMIILVINTLAEWYGWGLLPHDCDLSHRAARFAGTHPPFTEWIPTFILSRRHCALVDRFRAVGEMARSIRRASTASFACPLHWFRAIVDFSRSTALPA